VPGAPHDAAAGSDVGVGYVGGALGVDVAVDTTGTPYIVFDYAFLAGGPGSGRELGLYYKDTSGELRYARVVSEITLTSTLAGQPIRRAYFLVGSHNLTRLDFHVRTRGGPTLLAAVSVNRAAGLPSIGSSRQQARTFEVPGSKPTQGSISIVSATGALDDVIFYTNPVVSPGYQPPLSPFYNVPAMSRSTAAGNVSGKANRLMGDDTNPDTSFTTQLIIPADAVPAGEHQLVVKVTHKGNTGGFIDNFTVPIIWWARTKMGGSFVGPVLTGIYWHTYTLNVPVILPLTLLNLPILPVGPEGFIQISLAVAVTPDGPFGADSPDNQNVELDEAWLFHTAGRLTVVRDVPAKRLVIRAPSALEPGGSLWFGNDADGGDWISATASADCRDHHDLQPGPNGVLVVTTGQTDAVVTGDFYPHVHTHTYRLDT
jgi:hypothetical protein